MHTNLPQVQLYTDGACSGNPGSGGWAAILIYGQHTLELSGGEPDTTNNRMELLGIIKGLHALRARVSITIYSDSAYVVNAFLQRWLYGWQQNGWRTASKKPVKNVDLWQQLLAALQPHQYTFVKVKGHADNYYNNRCDYLAVAAIDKS